MSDERLHITTEEQRERLYAARRTGQACAACGRPLDPGEVVYHERFRLAPVMLRTGKVLITTSVARGPVGMECASPELLAWRVGTEPVRCAGCGRGVYYGTQRPGRQRALCSTRCAGRASAAKRHAKERT